MTTMRTIGLLGGMSWVSTGLYYRLINEETGRRLGDDHCAPLVVWQRDFAELTALQRADRWDDAGEFLAGGTRALVAAGAQVLAIGANTMHLVADAVVAAAGGVPLVHVVDVVRDACVAAGAARVALLGTQYTMESPVLYPPRLNAAGIEVMTPDPDERVAIHRATYEVLTRGAVTDEVRTLFRDVSERLVGEGADAVVLGCTEHGLALRDGDLAVPVIDSTRRHADALVTAAID